VLLGGEPPPLVGEVPDGEFWATGSGEVEGALAPAALGELGLVAGEDSGGAEGKLGAEGMPAVGPSESSTGDGATDMGVLGCENPPSGELIGPRAWSMAPTLAPLAAWFVCGRAARRTGWAVMTGGTLGGVAPVDSFAAASAAGGVASVSEGAALAVAPDL